MPAVKFRHEQAAKTLELTNLFRPFQGFAGCEGSGWIIGWCHGGDVESS